MKKITFLSILFWVTVCFAWSPPADKLPSIQGALANPVFNAFVAGGDGEGSSCDPDTNEVGIRTQEATAENIPAGYQYIFRAQADCTGTLGTAFLYHNDTASDAVKVCVYNSANADPTVSGATDALVGCSAEILSGESTGFKSGEIGTGEVTENGWYWVVMFGNEAYDNWGTQRASSASLWYGTSLTYASPEANLGTSWTEAASYAPYSCYVEIE